MVLELLVVVLLIILAVVVLLAILVVVVALLVALGLFFAQPFLANDASRTPRLSRTITTITAVAVVHHRWRSPHGVVIIGAVNRHHGLLLLHLVTITDLGTLNNNLRS